MLVFLFGIPSIACAEEYQIRTRHFDFQANDGFMDAGSYLNPYIIEDQSGREIGQIRSQFPDFDPNDGFMDAGSYLNPYIVEVD